MIDAGSRYEVDYPSGLSHLLEKLSFQVHITTLMLLLITFSYMAFNIEIEEQEHDLKREKSPKMVMMIDTNSHKLNLTVCLFSRKQSMLFSICFNQVDYL